MDCKYWFFALLFILLTAVNSSYAKSKADGLIPTEHFARSPGMESVQLSPSGKKLAFIASEGDDTVLVTYDLETRKKHPVLKTDNVERNINWYRWATDQRLVISIRINSSIGKTKVYETRLLGVDANGANLMALITPKQDVAAPITSGPRSGNSEWVPQFMDSVASWLPHDPEYILISADFEEINQDGIYKIGVSKKSRVQVGRRHQNVHHWIADAGGTVFVGIERTNNIRRIHLTKAGSVGGRVLWEYDLTKESGPYPLDFDDTSSKLIVRSIYNDKYAIFSVDIDSNDLALNLLGADDNYDIDGSLIRSPKTNKIVGVYYHGDRGRAVFWDDGFNALQKGIDKAIPTGHNQLISFSADESRYIVRHSEPNFPDVYLLGDRNAKTLDVVGGVYPELEKETLPQRKYISFTTRDGLTLEGYLTLPAGSKAEKLPSVIFPHGGPSARDTSEFDLWAAFIASRGYAVLQVNFRGSSGYGADFRGMQMHSWGLELQDDVTDSANWLVKEGVADKDRICIVGASYGGYAALMGAIKTPDLFKCAVSFAGVTDMFDFIDFQRNFMDGYDIAKLQFGGKWTDRERLRNTSPIENVKQIKIPILLVHGSEDRVVPVRQGDAMTGKLKSAKVKVKYIRQSGGDHSLSRYRHRLEFFRELENFLGANLK